jgi:hypothetical protein
MKKYLAAVLLMIIALHSSAQEFSIGPKIGISQGNLNVSGNEFSSADNKLGYHAGLFARLGGNRIFLQPEVLYTNTGGDFQQDQGANTVHYSASFDRIDVPLIIGLKFAQFFRVQVGPSLTFLIDSSLESDDPAFSGPDYNTSTVGYQAGIGFDIANMILDLKYEGALGRHAESVAGFPTDQRQSQLILSLGIRLF